MFDCLSVIFLLSLGGCLYEPNANGLVTLPKTLTSLKDYAFYGCTSMKSVELPSSLVEIGSWVFQGCISLTSIAIPSSVKIIGQQVFQGCPSLATASYYYGTSVGAHAFDQTGYNTTMGTTQVTVRGICITYSL